MDLEAIAQQSGLSVTKLLTRLLSWNCKDGLAGRAVDISCDLTAVLASE